MGGSSWGEGLFYCVSWVLGLRGCCVIRLWVSGLDFGWFVYFGCVGCCVGCALLASYGCWILGICDFVAVSGFVVCFDKLCLGFEFLI